MNIIQIYVRSEENETPAHAALLLEPAGDHFETRLHEFAALTGLPLYGEPENLDWAALLNGERGPHTTQDWGVIPRPPEYHQFAAQLKTRLTELIGQDVSPVKGFILWLKRDCGWNELTTQAWIIGAEEEDATLCPVTPPSGQSSYVMPPGQQKL